MRIWCALRCSLTAFSCLALPAAPTSSPGTPGLPDPAARAARAARDDALAAALRRGGLPAFLHHWYELPMWAQLRASPRCAPLEAARCVEQERLACCAGASAPGQRRCAWLIILPRSMDAKACPLPSPAPVPRFEAVLRQRLAGGDAAQLAAVLSAASPGRAPSVWRELEAAAGAGTLPPLLLVAGRADAKFVRAAEQLAARLAPAGGATSDDEGDWHLAAPAADDVQAEGGGAAPAEVAVLPGAGHAVHIERPAELLATLQRFLDRR